MRILPGRSYLVVLGLVAFLTLPAAAQDQTSTIEGTVTEAETLVPLGGANVEVLDAAGEVVGNATADASGAYRVSGLSAGAYTVVITLLGYETERVADLQVAAGQTVTVAGTLPAVALALNPVVVSVGRTAERALEAPARVEIVGTESIRQRPSLTPVDHLRGVPGVDVATTGLQSTNVVVRGFNNVFSGELHTLTDHRIAGVPSLRVNLMHLVPAIDEDIDRMEVVLGPGAALYGPNTASGVLHILTQSPLEEQGNVVSMAFGERGVAHGTFRSAQRLGENVGLKLSGQYLRGDEWEYADSAEVSERQKFAANPDFWRNDLMMATGIEVDEAIERIDRIGLRDFELERWSGEARLDWQPTPDLNTVFSVGTTNMGSAVELTGLGAAQAKDWRYTYYQARATWNRAFAQVYLNTSDAGDTFLLRNGAPIRDESKMFVGQLQHGFSLADRYDFTYGADFLYTLPETHETINGIYEDDDETQEFGAYLQAEAALSPRFDLVMAGRVDTHSALPDAIFSPRAALVFKPSQDHNLRFTFNRAFSTPTSINQFLDLGTPNPDPRLAALGYSLRVQGTGENGFRFDRTDGGYLMRSPFTPADQGGPSQLVPANATDYWGAAVQVAAQAAAQAGRPVPPELIGYLQALQPTPDEVGTRFLHPGTRQGGSLSELDLQPVDPIRESTSTTYEVGYKGILGGRLLLAADGWFTQRKNLVTPLTVQTPLLFLDGEDIGGYLVPRLMSDLGMSQEGAAAIAELVAEGAGIIPVGVISSEEVNANGAQLLMSYTNVDDEIELWGTDISATALLTDNWSVGVTGSLVNKDQVTAASGQLVTLNAPKRKASLSATYQNPAIGFNGQARVRYSAAFPVSSGVYQATDCLDVDDEPGVFTEPCVDSYTLFDLTLGYELPMMRAAALQLSVQNLFDRDYRSFPGVPNIGRLALLRLQYRF